MNHNNTVRAFIAIPIPKAVKDYLSNLIFNFQQTISENSIKWVDPNNIHLTLKFLGDLTNSAIKNLTTSLESNKLSSFELKIEKVGAFPSIYKPRVIWVGISKNDVLNNLAGYIKEVTQFIQPEENDKPFSPHLTIARIKPGIKNESYELLKKVLVKNREIEPIQFPVSNYCVFQSKLTPKGPIYSVLNSYDLNS